MFVTANEARHQSQGDGRSRAQEHELMRACLRESRGCVCRFDAFNLRVTKCERRQQAVEKFPLRAPSFAPSNSSQHYLSGETERCFWRSSEELETRQPQPFPSRLPAVWYIIIHLGLQPQTPPSHPLSCFCHSDVYRSLRLSPVKNDRKIILLGQEKVFFFLHVV